MMNSTDFEKLIAEIIREQSLIIGTSIARERAEDTGLIRFNSSKIDDISILSSAEPGKIVSEIIGSYEELFGGASVEVCLEVIKKYDNKELVNILPENLRKALNG